MPIHPSWEKIQENFKQQYGDRWEEVFWAWMNEHGYDETEPAEGQIKGEECKKEEEDKERPPKDWFDKCVESVSKNPDVEDPESLCGWIWYHGKKEELSEEEVKKLNEEFKKEGGEEMVIEYLEQLIKEMEEALDQLENALEKKRISELPTT
jgi:coenzyme F420-reducing hydrogenase alpha subunit